jgi:hypothetical protein
MKRTTLLFLVGLALGPGLVFARPPGHPPGTPAMAARCHEMMTDMKAMDARLDEKLGAVNAAQGEAKVDAMATLLNEIVSQRKAMHEKMVGMPPMVGCPMMSH